MRTCPSCNREQPLWEFPKSRKKCRECVSLERAARRAIKELEQGIGETITCSKCNKEKNIKSFYLNDRTCRDCRSTLNQARIYEPENNYYHYRKRLCDAAKHRAIKHGVPHTITPSDIVIPQFCPVLGIPLIISKGPITPNSPSLDRLNPSLGYTPQNITVMSFRANTIKNNASPTELRLVAGWLEQTLRS